MEIETRKITFNDHAIKELAEVNASCALRLQYGRCRDSECESCALYKQRMNCYKNMNDYDRARLHQRTSERYACLSLNPEPFYSGNRLLVLPFVMLAIEVVVLIIILVSIHFMNIGAKGDWGFAAALCAAFEVSLMVLTIFNPEWWQQVKNGLWLKKLDKEKQQAAERNLVKETECD